MRSIITFLVCSLFLTPVLYADETPTQFMGKWVEGYNKNDAKLITAFYDESEEIDVLVSFGVWLRGFEAVKKMYGADMQAARFYDSKAEGMKSRVVGEVAVVSFIHKFKYEIREESVKYRIHIRTTTTLRKAGDSWKIISEHSSAIKGIERAVLIKEEKGAKYKHLILPDAPTNRMVKRLSEVDLKAVDINSVNWQKAVELINEAASGIVGRKLLSPIALGESKDKVTLRSESINFADCMDEICEKAGLKWTIYFYAGQVNHPMLVYGKEAAILRFRSSKDKTKNMK